jgi:signal transduction histidine kinase
VASAEKISFPDAPRSELERTIEELVERAQRVLTTQGRLRSLLRANRVVVEQLDLEEVLRRIAEAAVDLVDAQYGALGVIGPDGFLERFIHVGIPDAMAAKIGHLPHGIGVLGAVIHDAAPIRLEHLHDDPRSSGFPAAHPPMDAFLGVPIRVRDDVYGNLYLTNPAAGRFTQEDEELVSVLAATAGVAIENARLFDEVRVREKWTNALAEVSAALLSDDVDALEVIVEQVADVVDAALACILTPGADGMLIVSAAHGPLAEGVRNRRFPADGSLAGRVIASGEMLLVDGQAAGAQFASQPETGPTFIVPLSGAGGVLGALAVSRPVGGARIADADIGRATDFARQASVALQLVRGRLDRQQLERMDDRSRIARDLHDHVIQRLFGAGLALQAQSMRADVGSRAALLEQVDAIDAAIAEIRTVIFALSAPAPGTISVRHRVLDVVNEIGAGLAAPPRLTFGGAVDLVVPDEMVDDVVAVVRESLANVARHAQATTTDVDVQVDGDRLIIQVDDDGVGYAPGGRASGTANIAARAELLGGTYTIGPRETGGTTVMWTAPLPQEQP